MKNFAAPITLALACIAYGLVVGCEFYFAAQAQDATTVRNSGCLVQKMDALNQKTKHWSVLSVSWRFRSINP